MLPLLGVLAWLASGCDVGSTSATEPSEAREARHALCSDEGIEGGQVERYTDLLRLARHGQVPLEGGEARPEVWDRGGHYRAVLAQLVPSRISLGPVSPGSSCRLRFGLWEGKGTSALRIRVAVQGRDGGDGSVFEATVRGDESGRWVEEEVALPEEGTKGSFRLILEASVDAGRGVGREVAWGAPHVVCRVPRPPARASDQPDVVLVSVDTLRADRLGAYGYEGETSPFLNRFAKESLLFTQAFAPAPWTLPSHATLFTGLPPERHEAGHRTPTAPLPDDPATLAELLAGAGYRTVAFSAGGILSRRNGLARGFQWWTERTRANIDSVLPGVFDAVGIGGEDPLLLFLHTYDVHGPYAYLPGPPRLELEHAAALRGQGDADAWERLKGIPALRYQRFERFEGLDEVSAAYDAGIRFVDAALARLMARLCQVRDPRNALIVVTSDHGESLHDHGIYVGHTQTLYDVEVQVPLLVRLPGASAKGQFDVLTGLEDVLPLILEVVGVEPPPGLGSSSPLSRREGRVPPRTRVFGEAVHSGARFARSARWKWVTAPLPLDDPRSRVPRRIWDRLPLEAALYDLEDDPGELRSRLAEGASLPRETLALREALERRAGPGPVPEEQDEWAPALREALRSLGYIE